jgi:hypothetical protein
MRALLYIGFYIMSASLSVYAAETYVCPKLAIANGHELRARNIDLYSGPPSEMAQLKPDNADTDNTDSPYWSMGPSKYDYWYVCNYKSKKSKLEFKLPKTYEICTNIGSDKILDKLRCK